MPKCKSSFLLIYKLRTLHNALQTKLPGGHEVGDTVYSLISHNSSDGNRSKDIEPGSKGTVKGSCDNSSLSDASERINVLFDSGLKANIRPSQISKTKPPPQHQKHYSHRHTLKAHQSRGWRCDVCGRSDLGRSDERWRCTEGCDWDCCGQCIAKKKHSAHSHTLKANQSGGWNCDVCGRSGLDRSDERWRCAEGCDWDCCSRCIV